MFKNVMSYMKDRKSTKRPIDHVKTHLKSTIKGPVEIQDEAYVQVLKQIKDNPKISKEKRGWRFFSLIASCYAPSDELFYSILNYLLFEIKNNKDNEIVGKTNYIFSRLVKSYNQARTEVPCTEEILCIEVN
jgi:hypothetical protein